MALPTPGPEARDRVSRAQLTAFRAAVGPASVVSVVCALLAAWALEPLVGRGVLWPWLSLLLSVLALRALLTLRMGPAAEPTRAMRVLRGAAALHGLAWGSLVLWIGPLGGSTALTDTLVVVIGGVVLTALPLALIDGGAALAFVAPAVLPLAWRVLESPQPASRQVLLAGVLLLVLCGVMAGSARAAAGWRSPPPRKPSRPSWRRRDMPSSRCAASSTMSPRAFACSTRSGGWWPGTRDCWTCWVPTPRRCTKA
jgi:hypothetical protein